MSLIVTATDATGPGIWTLQHKGFHQQQFDLQFRASMRAVRVLDSDDNKGGLGQWQIDSDSAGDIPQFLCWKPRVPAPQFGHLTRAIAGWSQAWATVTNLKGTPTSGQGCATLSDNLSGMSPIRDDAMIADPRYEIIGPRAPKKNGKRLWPKFPKGYYGIGLAGANEEVQVEYFHPTDPRLVAVQRKGDVEMGSLVCDMGDGFEIDQDRMARLQALAWTIKKPTGCVDFFGENALAWNIGPSGCRDVRGGTVIDEPTERALRTTTVTAMPGDERTIGLASSHSSGPFDTGSVDDQHEIGVDADGHKINALHLHTNTYFRRGRFEDAPLHFEIWKDSEPASRVSPVHLGLAPFPHPFVCGAKLGLWKWWCETPISTIPPYMPVPTPGSGNGRTTATTTTPGELPPPSPGVTPGTTVVPEPGFGGQPFNGTSNDPTRDNPRGLPYGFPNDGGPLPMAAWKTGDQGRWIAASDMETALPALLGRPNSFNSGVLDLRNAVRVSKDQLDRSNDYTPIVGRIESYGVETASGWTYTQSPKASRYRGGTSSGGWVVLPPEVDMATSGDTFAPSGVTRSTVYWVWGPNTFAAWGLPSRTTGGITSGYRSARDADANLNFDAVNGSGTVVSGPRFDASGRIAIADTLGASTNRGIFTGRFTADRTFTFPDTSGTLGFGSVTSVGLSMPAQFAVTGSPVTGSGTLASTWNAQVANTLLAGPASGADAVPTFRAMVAADLVAHNLLSASHGDTTAAAAVRGALITGQGVSATWTRLDGLANRLLRHDGTDIAWSQAVLTTDVTGTLPIANGGTGQTTAVAAFDALAPTTTQGDIIYHNGTDNVRLAPGTSGQVLQTQGAGANPVWATAGSEAAANAVLRAERFN